jgi:hypothetical protein
MYLGFNYVVVDIVVSTVADVVLYVKNDVDDIVCKVILNSYLEHYSKLDYTIVPAALLYHR